MPIVEGKSAVAKTHSFRQAGVREFTSLPFPASKAAQVRRLMVTFIFKARIAKLSLLSANSYLLVGLPVALLRI